MHEPIRYTVRIPSPISHYAEVEGHFPTNGASTLELFLPVWTPGSYLIREYARHIEDVQGTKTRKNRWLIETAGLDTITVKYRVYCNELSVRTNFIDDRFALLQGAATFLTSPAMLDRQHEVILELPTGWHVSATGLRGQEHRYTAEDYDMLVDSPILMGNSEAHEFSVDGKPHYLVNEGADGEWDVAKSVGALEKIIECNRAMWGSLPYEKFVFLNILGEGAGGGGLEHKNSFYVLASRYATGTRQAYVSWPSLVSHEFFHVWNVKRMRPAELGPFDYENENYTTGLWVAEGFTNYYDRLTLVRAGLTTKEEFLASLSSLIESLQTTPGRLVQSVANASYDAWIKHYRPDENSVNSAISYYVKGAVIAFLLDAKIRAATAGVKSLDDVLRLAYLRYSAARGFTEDEFRSVICAISGVDLLPWIHDAVDTTRELNYAEALHYYGLHFKTADSPLKSWLGCEVKNDHGRLLVKTGSENFSAGDEIIAIGDYRISAEQWPQRMEQLQPGGKVSVLLARRERLIRVDSMLFAERTQSWKLEMDAGANEALTAWLAQPQQH